MLSSKTLTTLAALSVASLATAAPAASDSVSSSSFDDTPYNGALAQACVDNHPTRDDVFHVWEDLRCVLAAVGTNVRTKPIDSFLAFNFGDHIDNSPASAGIDLPPSDVIARLAYGGSGPITAQSWVDAYYGALADLGGPYPQDVSEITKFYDNVADWTGNCDGSIPNSEFADYIKYSSSVNGNSGCVSIAEQVAAGDVPAVTDPSDDPSFPTSGSDGDVAETTLVDDSE